MNQEISKLSKDLENHPLYQRLDSLDNLKIFMEYHVFAVFDFMCLLKSLQKYITFDHFPWKPSGYPDEIVRFVNEIVLCEESDLDVDGQPCSHFNLYIKAMHEVGAQTHQVLKFVNNLREYEYDASELPEGIKEFVSFNLDLSMDGQVEEVAAAFLYGREILIPHMFAGIVPVLNAIDPKPKALIYYLERHIEVDGDEHGPMAEKCIQAICEENKLKWAKAEKTAIKSLNLRINLWDKALEQINSLS
jgi:hypothetical protein